MNWVKSQIFARIARVFAGVALTWWRVRQLNERGNISVARTTARRARLEARETRFDNKARMAEDRVEALHRVIRGEPKKPDQLKRVA